MTRVLLVLALLLPVVAAAQVRRPDLDQVEERIVEGTNAFRHSQRLPDVAIDRKLSRAAQSFADYMAKHDELAHAADGKQPWDRARAQGYDYCLVSENIGYQFHSRGFETAELARAFVEGWKHSPGHRKNMMERDAIDIGVAVARSAKTGRYYAVQMFGRPKVSGRCGRGSRD